MRQKHFHCEVLSKELVLQAAKPESCDSRPTASDPCIFPIGIRGGVMLTNIYVAGTLIPSRNQRGISEFGRFLSRCEAFRTSGVLRTYRVDLWR